MDDFFDHIDDEAQVGARDDLDLGVTATTDKQVLANINKSMSKRVLKPRLRLDERRLCGPLGIKSLHNYFTNWKPNPNKDEYENLASLMGKMEQWAHRLYPNFNFEDTVARVEQLGEKRLVKSFMQNLRMGISIDENQPDVDENWPNRNPANNLDDPNDILSDPIIPNDQAKCLNEPTTALNDDFDPFDEVFGTGNGPETSCHSVEQSNVQQSALTDEQVKRMEKSRERAKKLRQDCLLKCSEPTEIVDQQCSNIDKSDNRETISEIELNEDEIMAELLGD